MDRFGNLTKPLAWSMAALLAGVVAGCGGGGDGGGAAPAPAPAAAIGDISGDWTITETDISSTAPQCVPPSNPLATYPVTVAQTGDSVTVTDGSNPSSGPVTFNGSLHGAKLTWNGSFPERGGTTTWDNVNLAVGTDCNTASGTYSWTYVQDPPATFSCTATTTLTAARNNPTGCTAPTPPSSS